MVRLATDQLVERGRVLVENWEKNELVVRPNGKVTKEMRLLSNEDVYLQIDFWGFTKYACKALGQVHDVGKL